MVTGSSWWETVPDKLGPAYTDKILAAIAAGDAVIDWITITDGDLEFEIMRAPLAIGTHADHVFALGLSAEAVDRIALAFEARGLAVMSPTPYLWDRAAEDPRQRQIGPHTLPSLIGQQNGAAGMTKSAAKAHADAIAADRPESCSFISGSVKTYVLHPYKNTADGIRDGYSCEYGWRLPGPGWGSPNVTGSGYVVQPAQWAHSYGFFDYSMGAVYVKARAILAGEPVDLREMVTSDTLASRITVSGAVPYVINPELENEIEDPPDTDPNPPHPEDRPEISKGSKGPDVADWQRELMRAGFALAPYNDDGDFGSLTHNATVGWQRERGIASTGVVGADSWAAMGSDPEEREEPDGEITATILCRNFTRANRTDIKNLCIHTMEATEASTTAEAVANWGASLNAPRASWHYAIDDENTILCCEEKDVAWCAPGLNKIAIHLEHAGYARQSLDEWLDPFSRRMLARSAKLAAAICARWNIPIEFVDAAGLLKGDRGITTHYQVTKGPGKGRTTHTDPGRHFPMDLYLQMIRDATK